MLTSYAYDQDSVNRYTYEDATGARHYFRVVYVAPDVARLYFTTANQVNKKVAPTGFTMIDVSNRRSCITLTPLDKNFFISWAGHYELLHNHVAIVHINHRKQQSVQPYGPGHNKIWSDAEPLPRTDFTGSGITSSSSSNTNTRTSSKKKRKANVQLYVSVFLRHARCLIVSHTT